jgi:outer membrane biosynthesis protein TonB
VTNNQGAAMATRFDHSLRFAAAALLLLTLAACDKPPAEVPAPSPAPAESAPETAPVPPPTEETPPVETPAAPAQPESTPPPPEEPSAVPKPTAALVGPDLESMQIARPSAKLSVPVDLRYQFDSEPLPGQPAMLHLAAVPRVSGSNLKVSIKQAEGVQFGSAGPLRVQKATPSGVYRQQLSVTRTSAGPQNLRVLVTMDMGDGIAFGYFSIPFSSGPTAQKLDSVKQR